MGDQLGVCFIADYFFFFKTQNMLSGERKGKSKIL